MKTPIRAAVSAVALATAVAGCTSSAGGGASPPASPLGAVRLVAYDSCDELLAGLRERAARNVGAYGFGGVMPLSPVAARADAAVESKAYSGAPEHSTTNVHEEGVDEPDMVKTDGDRVLTVTDGTLRVIDTATRKVISSLKLTEGDAPGVPGDLLVSGDRALVLLRGGDIMYKSVDARPPGDTLYVLVDLAGTPKVLNTVRTGGSYVDARMVGSTVRLVTRDQPAVTFPDPGPDATETERIKQNQDAVRRAPAEAWLPTVEITDAAGAVRKESVPCERVSHPADYTGTSMLTVHTIDLARGLTDTGTDPIALAADGDIVYGTGRSLYVASNPRWWLPIVRPLPIDDVPATSDTPATPDTPATSEIPATSGAPATSDAPATPDAPATTKPAPATPGGPARPVPSGDGAAPAEEPTPAEPTLDPALGRPVVSTALSPTATITLSASEPPVTPDPRQPSLLPEPEQPPEETEIHRFDLTAPGAPAYAASGKVPGRLLNQYALSEHDGHLRVATTLNSADDRTSSSSVHVLRADTMAQVGEVGGLGKGERIYSVRFIGPVGYCVTFRQVDPLYTLDLRDPAAPKVTGELKITGYSAYLHPAGEGRLIGIGQEASEQGRTLGTQVSLFDVSDPAAPRRLSQLFQKDSGSGAEWDPHAFLYWPKTGLSVIPLTTQDDSGALALRIDDAGVTELGRISHPAREQGRLRYQPGIQRSLVIGDALWTLSPEGAQVNDLTTLEREAWIPLR